MDIGNTLARWTSQAPKDVWLAKGDLRLPPQVIWSQANCLATGLLSLGLQPTEGVALWTRPSLSVIITCFATQLSGGVFAPIRNSLKDAEIIDAIIGCRASLAIISLNLYDRYHSIESKLRTVRNLIVDSGEVSAEATLPANAKSLTPMLMVGRDVTLPETEPGGKAMCFAAEGDSEPFYVFREEEMWAKALKAASVSFNRNGKILNTANLLEPDALLLGAILPLLAYSSVYLPDNNPERNQKLVEKNEFDALIVDSNSAEIVFGQYPGVKASRILWSGAGIEKEAERIEKTTGVKPIELSRAVDSAGFFKGK